MSKAAFIILLLSSLFVPPALAIVGTPTPEAGPRLVLFPPWRDGLELVQKAGGDLVGPVQAPMGLLAFAADGSDFNRRLRDAGAWAVIDGTSIARLCGVSTTTSTKGTET